MRVLKVLINSSRNIKLLWLSVFLRMFAYGASNIVLTQLLKALGVSEQLMGVFMALTLVGDAGLTLLLTWHADRLGRRWVVMGGAALMCISGLIFSHSGRFSVLLLAAVAGVVSPSGDEVGPFKAIEEAMLARLALRDERAEVYCWHWLLGAAGGACGSLVAGMVVQSVGAGLDSYRLVFLGYAALGGIKLVALSMLGKECELEPEEDALLTVETIEDVSSLERQEEAAIPAGKHVLHKLLTIFMLDSLGSGFLNSAWMVYYYKTRFLTEDSALGLLFFSTNIANALSALPSAHLANTLGPVRSTLIAQVPSMLFLGTVPAMATFPGAVVLTVLHYATSAMDVVPRQVLLTAVLKPRQLTRSLGAVNIAKTFARCIGPVITGRLAGKDHIGVAFIASAGLVLLADALLATLFYGIDERIVANK